ncbi:mitochondrial carrier domain-containing protein [Dichotomocladium elegans]|nr:mitochondrial carrier domain-containing protein [Dichotomocladium elegans]
MSDYMFLNNSHRKTAANPLRPYSPPVRHHLHNYTSLDALDAVPDPTLEDLDDSQTHFRETTTQLTSLAAFKYILNLLNSPLEVGTTLLQVQYAPHERAEVLASRDEIVAIGNNNLETSALSTSSSEEDEDGGFFTPIPQQQERRARSRASSRQMKIRKSITVTSSLPAYSVYDSVRRPAHQMAPLPGDSTIFDILQQVIKLPSEGWMSLFKGQRVAWIHDMLWCLLQPGLEGFLNDIFGIYDDTIPIGNILPNIITSVVSHVVIGVLLSPLEIIRTRLTVQSASNAKYNGIIQAFKVMCAEEGGVRSMYLSRNLAPTILYHTARPLLDTSIPMVIERTLGLAAPDSPILYGTAELTMRMLGLVVIFPLETIRKRLQCQAPNYETVVALRPVPYNGILDALYRIMKEEGTQEKHEKKEPQPRLMDSSDSEDDDFMPVRRRQETRGPKSAWGIRGLYRGLGMQVAATSVDFLMRVIDGDLYGLA